MYIWELFLIKKHARRQYSQDSQLTVNLLQHWQALKASAYLLFALSSARETLTEKSGEFAHYASKLKFASDIQATKL